VIESLKGVGIGERMDACRRSGSGGETAARRDLLRAVISGPQLFWRIAPTGDVDPALGRRLDCGLFIRIETKWAPRLCHRDPGHHDDGFRIDARRAGAWHQGG